MPMTKARRQQLVLGWFGIALTWAASVILEVVLLGTEAVLAVVVTTTVALIVGVQLTRRAMAPHRRASITVGDLRERRLERR
jgi:hypothetical protein